jgi:hypothetical protein
MAQGPDQSRIISLTITTDSTFQMNSPRIYVYKITFDEIPHYYYGIHKEKTFDEYYMGTPVTHKLFWQVCTPNKEIIRTFDYTDTGWIEAQKFEQNLIKPVFNNDPLCLNENCGGLASFKMIKENGSKGGKIGGRIIHELNLGIHGLTEEQMVKNARKGGKAGSLVSNSIKWKCIVTGYVSTSGGLSVYQKSRGIDTSNRIKVDGSRIWEITFDYGKVIVVTGSLSKWATENGYRYYNLINVRTGKSLNHKGIIKVVPS